MSDLVEFLRARLAQEEEWARDDIEYSSLPAVVRYAQHTLADVEAKRKLVAFYQGVVDQDTEPMEDVMRAVREVSEIALVEAVKLLALPYAGHPEFREEWKP